mmetsp:Transcript_97585/g.252353  ORF Transcript_97585/g.252353 Transcript_97585/m.252353 type:complete len:259 (-) Transcript_97585:31-807(-)
MPLAVVGEQTSLQFLPFQVAGAVQIEDGEGHTKLVDDLLPPKIQATGRELDVAHGAALVLVQLSRNDRHVRLRQAQLFQRPRQLRRLQRAVPVGVVAREQRRQGGEIRHVQLRRHTSHDAMLKVRALLKRAQALGEFARAVPHPLARGAVPPRPRGVQPPREPRARRPQRLVGRGPLLRRLLQQHRAELPPAPALDLLQPARRLGAADEVREEHDVVRGEGELTLRQHLVQHHAKAPQVSLKPVASMEHLWCHVVRSS